MERKQVPQDDSRLLNGLHEIQYALDEKGKYVQVPSTGWEPKNIALIQAREVYIRRAGEALTRVKAGELSPLAYHMELNMMDVKLLARYAGLSRWTVRRHLDPRRFAKAAPDVLRRYATALNLSLEELRTVPADSP